MRIKDFCEGQRCPHCANERRSKTLMQGTEPMHKKKSYYPLKTEEEIYSIFNRINSLNNFKFDYVSFQNDSSLDHSDREITLTCNECGNTFSKKYFYMLYNKQGCPCCSKGKTGKKNSIDFIKSEFLKHGFTLEGEYINSHTPVKIRCNNCGELQERSFNTIVNLNGRCNCQKNESKGEQLIQQYFKNKNIEYISGKTFSGLKYDSPLRCDIFVESLNLVIEYDGLQHFKEREQVFFHDSLETIQKRDRCKEKFLLENNINVLRISYKSNTQKVIDKILDDTINYLTDGKPYDWKQSRTVWFGGKSDINEYLNSNK